MGSGVGKTFDVKVTAVDASGGVVCEVLEFEGRPPLRQLHEAIESRMRDAHPALCSGDRGTFEVACLKTVDDGGEWREVLDTAQLRSGQALRAVQPEQSDADIELPVRTKARIAFKYMDAGRKGYIDAADVKNALVGGATGLQTSLVFEWFQEADRARTGRISLRAWHKFATSYPAVVAQIYEKLRDMQGEGAVNEALRPHYMATTRSYRQQRGRRTRNDFNFNFSVAAATAAAADQSHGTNRSSSRTYEPPPTFEDESWTARRPVVGSGHQAAASQRKQHQQHQYQRQPLHRQEPSRRRSHSGFDEEPSRYAHGVPVARSAADDTVHRHLGRAAAAPQQQYSTHGLRSASEAAAAGGAWAGGGSYRSGESDAVFSSPIRSRASASTVPDPPPTLDPPRTPPPSFSAAGASDIHAYREAYKDRYLLTRDRRRCGSPTGSGAYGLPTPSQRPTSGSTTSVASPSPYYRAAESRDRWSTPPAAAAAYERPTHSRSMPMEQV